jgi:TldD protein
MNETPSTTDIAIMVPKDSVEKLLSAALSRGGDFAEVYIQRSKSTSIPLEERKIRSAETRISQGVGIRVLSGEKTGYAYSDNLEMKSLLQAAQVAAQIAEGPGVERPVRVTAQPAPVYYRIGNPPGTSPVAEKTSLTKRASKAAYQYDHRIKQVDAAYADSEQEFIVANSDGLWISDKETMLRIWVSCLATQGIVSQVGTYGGGGRIGMEYFDRVPPEEIAREAARMAVIQLDAVPAPAGMMPVVIKNGWGGVLFHESVGHGLEADFVRKKTSIFTDRIGEKVASTICTIVDDATLPNRRGSYNMDDEGTPGQRKVLIENGVLKGYLTDRLNGGLMGIPLTGNGRRQSYHDYPIPRMTNFFMEAGDSDPEEIVRSVDRGVYAAYFSGGQVDITNGNFTFSITEGYLIENGKLTSPIKGATLIGNGPDIMQKIVMVGSDLELDKGIGTCGKNGQSAPTGVGMPTVKVSEMTVGGTAT